MPIVLNRYYHNNTDGHMLNWLWEKIANLEKLPKKRTHQKLSNLENIIFVCDAVKHGVESVEKVSHLKM